MSNKYIIVHLIISTYRLDRTVFRAGTAADATDYTSRYIKLTWQERLRVANYLNSIAYDYPVDTLPAPDKTQFNARSRNV